MFKAASSSSPVAHKVKIAVLPMASTEYDEEAQEVINDFQMLDAEVHVLNFDRTEANNVLLAAHMKNFPDFGFSVVNQNRLAEILINTRALMSLERRYQEGAVVGVKPPQVPRSWRPKKCSPETPRHF